MQGKPPAGCTGVAPPGFGCAGGAMTLEEAAPVAIVVGLSGTQSMSAITPAHSAVMFLPLQFDTVLKTTGVDGNLQKLSRPHPV
jgi:hypothetical protein